MISVVIPVLNEEANIDWVVRFARRSQGVSEVLVVDDGSVDNTPEIAVRAGARVITSSLLGKGASMRDGTSAAKENLLVFLDGDMRCLEEGCIEKLVMPIVSGQADFVKAKFRRKAGRVTELTAKPLLAIFFPELSSLSQPLGGIIAARKTTLDEIQMENDYGVDLGIVIDMSVLGKRIREVDIGGLEHESQPLSRLSIMASQVIRVIFERAEMYGRFRIDQLRHLSEMERRALASSALEEVRHRESRRFALIDMDGTLLEGRFVMELAQRTQRTHHLARFLDRFDLTPQARTNRIARIFRGVPREEFESVAMEMSLTEGALELVRFLRRSGFVVGVVSDSFHVAVDIIRRRVFADFACAHLLEFSNQIATGNVEISRPMIQPSICKQHDFCKRNVMAWIAGSSSCDSCFIAIGDGANDYCMLRDASVGIAYRPKEDILKDAANYVIHQSLAEAIPLLIESGISAGNSA